MASRLIARIAQRSQFAVRDWEDRQLVLAAKAIMAAESWRTAPKASGSAGLGEKEFRVYSQFGDDGIIQYLICALGLRIESAFIEFGVGDFFESNSHFLLVNNNWRGFVIDGSDANIARVRSSSIYWKYDLQAISAFVTADNINQLIRQSGFEKIEYLHVDLDGNDYWILDSLDLGQLDPDILILEYNSLFGPERKITVPYSPTFFRTDAHHSGQYFGASLGALARLAATKGYIFIGCNSAGNNAYFLASRHREIMPPVTVRAGFVAARFRDSRDTTGSLSHLRRDQVLDSIAGLPVVNVESGSQEQL